MSTFCCSNRSDRLDSHRHGRTPVLVNILFALCFAHAALAAQSAPAAQNTPAAKSAPAVAKLSITQIVDKHVAARGGLPAWRAVQTLSVSGTMDAGSADSTARSAKIAREGMGATVKSQRPDMANNADKAQANAQVQLPFTLEMKRPRKSRLEIVFAGKTAVQVYDGTNGWKLRPFLNRSDVEPFTAEETKSADGKSDFEGPLLDYAAKGSKVELEGVEPVDGHDAYKLKLTLKNGDVQHIWIDAQSFLDVKIEGIPRRMDGRMRSVWVYQRDFRPVQGVMVPYLYETAVEGAVQTHKMTIQSVTVNRSLDDARFAKPQPLVASSGG
jgi:outer membrane lipoprotein-sorting protein